MFCLCFFFKQKTAYEMRISDWSSDVCSSDLARYLATVRHGASLSYAPARARVEREPELLELGPSYALYAVLDAVVDNYLPIVDEFKQTLLALEQDIFTEDFHRGTMMRLYDLKRELTYMRLAVTPLQEVRSQLVRNHGTLVPP